MRINLYQVVLAAGLCAVGSATHAASAKDCDQGFAVTVTNLTYQQVFSPPLAVAHKPSVRLFRLAGEASEGLEDLAEGGSTRALSADLAASGRACEPQTAPGPVPPGQSVTFKIPGTYGSVISVATMLVNTNDAFAAQTVRAPRRGGQVFRTAVAYDAGTERNDENCDNIPGPACNGEGTNFAEGGEGFVHVHRGVHGVGDLRAATYDWRNPVMRIRVQSID